MGRTGKQWILEYRAFLPEFNAFLFFSSPFVFQTTWCWARSFGSDPVAPVWMMYRRHHAFSQGSPPPIQNLRFPPLLTSSLLRAFSCSFDRSLFGFIFFVPGFVQSQKPHERFIGLFISPASAAFFFSFLVLKRGCFYLFPADLFNLGGISNWMTRVK